MIIAAGLFASLLAAVVLGVTVVMGSRHSELRLSPHRVTTATARLRRGRPWPGG